MSRAIDVKLDCLLKTHLFSFIQKWGRARDSLGLSCPNPLISNEDFALSCYEMKGKAFFAGSTA